MVKRQYLIHTLLFAYFSEAAASPWLPEVGRTNLFTSAEHALYTDPDQAKSVLLYEKAIRAKKIQLQQKIYNIANDPQASPAARKEKIATIDRIIQDLDKQINAIHTIYYWHRRITTIQTEYGLTENIAIGAKYAYAEVNRYASSQKQYQELLFYPKFALYKTDTAIISLAPNLQTTNAHRTRVGFTLGFGKAKILGKWRGYEFKLLDTVEARAENIKFGGVWDNKQYTINNILALEVNSRLWLLYELQYMAAHARYTILPHQYLRSKISLAYKMQMKQFEPALQISYFDDYWIESVRRKSSYNKITSGIGLGMWVAL